MSKRKFQRDTSALATERPVIDGGLYAGVITGASIESSNNAPYIIAEKEVKWTNGNREELENYTIRGRLNFSVLLTSKKAIKQLQRDEPRVFGTIYLNFDSETLALNEQDNIALGTLLKTFDLNDTDFDELVDFDDEEVHPIPEGLENEPNAQDLADALAYHRAVFTVMCQLLNNLPCTAVVLKQPSYRDKNVQENALSTGRESCGVMAYIEGSEEDLED